jgi:hypothetical protein
MNGEGILRGAIWGEVMISMGITEMMRLLPIAGMAWFSFFPSLLIGFAKNYIRSGTGIPNSFRPVASV